MRTVLTLLGIIFGVASVMVVGAGIEGLETWVKESVSKILGSDSFLLDKYAHIGELTQEEWEVMIRRNRDLRVSDIDFVRGLCPDCEEVVGEVGTSRNLYYGSEELFDTRVTGATANRIFLGSQELDEGRYFTDEEVRRSRFVVVVGAEIREKLFEGIDPIGKIVKVGTEPMEIVGALEKLGTTFGQSMDNVVHIPITTFQKIHGTRRSITIRGTAVTRDRFDSAIGQVRTAMRIRHKLKPGEDDTFGLISTEDINNDVDQFTQMIAVVVVPITFISLVVGGIVVMNIMLVSVTERTFEVGLRKSLGARRRDILNQFLIESFFLAASGGLIGLALATLVASIIEMTTPMTMTISLAYVLLALGVSGGVGIVFGIFPAYKASKLNPIDALRTER
jgi:putative ABC transport system permease protein